MFVTLSFTSYLAIDTAIMPFTCHLKHVAISNNLKHVLSGSGWWQSLVANF